ncbi:hypothetical protein DYB30_004115 [Aphanomyces astaci]|uniref:DUF3730 domain-containing protein n=2 Tax=Aphanomyces astaci TaxID=112090 RepID=A0A397D7T4_APHAT|nr:hypothetical protein DYB30_004115 [Aphanomyces astaci]
MSNNTTTSDADIVNERVLELERVLLRLGLTDDAKLCDVLRLLLPQLFQRLVTTAAPAVSAKILEIFSHLVKRLKSFPSTQIVLPVVALLPYVDPAPSDTSVPALHLTYARNFSLLFVEMGFGGCLSVDLKSVVLTTIVRGMATKSSAYHDVVFRLFVHVFLWQDTAVTLDDTTRWSRLDVAVLLDFFLDLMLCPSSSQSVPRTERLMRAKVASLEPASRTHVQLKLVQFLKQHATSSPDPTTPSNMDASAWYVHMATGAAAGHHSIATYCQDELSRLNKYHLPALDTASSIAPLCHLILGSSIPAPDDGGSAFLPRQPLPDLVALALVPVLLQAKSVATDCFPLNLQVVCTFLFGDSPQRPRAVKANVRKAGMDLCLWVLMHSPDAILHAALGPVLFSPLLKLVTDDDNSMTSDEVPANVRHERNVGVYTAFSILARRTPALVAATPEAFQRLMYRAMVEEERGRSGSACLEALRAVCAAYVGAHVPATVTNVIKRELTELASSSKVQTPTFDRVRGVLAYWASHMQFQGCSGDGGGGDLTMRVVCLRFAGDGSDQVREVARKAVFEVPLPPFDKTMSLLGPQLPSMAAGQPRVVLELALALCVGSLQAEDDARRHDVQPLVDACMALLAGSHKATAAETLVTVIHRMRLCELSVDQVSTITHMMLHDGDDGVRELMAILLATPSRTADCFHAQVQALTALLADDPQHACPSSEMHGALSGLGMLIRSNKAYPHKQAVATIVADTASVHLGKFVQYAMIRFDHGCKLHSDVVYASLQALGAMGNLAEVGTGAAVLDVVVRVLTLAPTPPPSDSATATLKLRAMQTLGCLVYGLPLDDDEVLNQVTSAVVATLKRVADTRDAWFQFQVATMLAAWGHVLSDDVAEAATTSGSRRQNRVTRVLDEVLAGISSANPHVRNSAAIWLFGIVSSSANTKRDHEVRLENEWTRQVRPRMLLLHELLVDLLNEKTALTQECAVKALAMLFDQAAIQDNGEANISSNGQQAAIQDDGIGGGGDVQNSMSDSLFKRLKCFRAFVDSAGPSAASATPSASDPSSTAANTIENACYREVSNVAADVGDASVMYTLLYLSTNDPMWDLLLLGDGDLSKGNLATAARTQPDPTNELASSTTIASVIRLPLNVATADREFGALQAHKAHSEWHASAIAELLVPRLFLLKNHPNPKIGNCMAQLWKVLVHGSTTSDVVVVASTINPDKAMANQYYQAILTYALQRLESSRNFKYREAACNAMVDILNGRDAGDVRGQLTRLWKLTARAVDDVTESVVVAGIKLVKCVGELSLRVAAVDGACLDHVLSFLVREGISASNKLCQALCMGYLLRLIKAIPSIHLQAYLSTLPVTLLQCMSSLEMPELQYAQFHVQDKRQLEKARVSLSQAGPVGELLQACMAQLSTFAASQGPDDFGRCAAAAPIVRDLCDGVCTVLRSGVGLNTRVGSANFVATLVTEVPLEMRHCGASDKLLLRIFTPFVTHAVLNETIDESQDGLEADGGLRDGLVMRAYCRAAAYVSKLAAPSTVAKYICEGILAVPSTIVVGSEGSSTTEKGFGRYGWVTVTALQELLAQVPPPSSSSDATTDWCVDVFSVAFVGQYSSQASLGAAWKAVLEAIPPTLRHSPQYAAKTLAYGCELMSHLSWECRKQGASAIIALASSPEYVISDWSSAVHKIKASIPGQLWRGKGIVLEALGATYIVTDCHDNHEKDEMVMMLVSECDRAIRNGDMSYLDSAIQSLGTLASVKSSPPSSVDSFVALKTFFFDDTSGMELPPLVRKRMFETLGKWWPVDCDTVRSSQVLAWLCSVADASTYPVWSVRDAMYGCLTHIVSRASFDALGTRQTMEALVKTCLNGVGDPKYAAVRRSALGAVVALASRRNDQGLSLVTLVPYKEELTAAATQLLLHDTEPSVCHAASDVLAALQAMH